jgi:hypothetical protein
MEREMAIMTVSWYLKVARETVKTRLQGGFFANVG